MNYLRECKVIEFAAFFKRKNREITTFDYICFNRQNKILIKLSNNIQLGKLGEQVAKDFLVKNGYGILETNFRFEHNEVDIICFKNGLLIFTEVKTRSSFKFGFPEEAVTEKKQDSLKKVAEFYMLEHPEYELCRFDIISCLIQGGKLKEIKHFEDAFY